MDGEGESDYVQTARYKNGHGDAKHNTANTSTTRWQQCMVPDGDHTYWGEPFVRYINV